MYFGLYFPSNKEFVTTVTELIAIAKPASIGSQPNTLNPRTGTNAPAATGIKPFEKVDNSGLFLQKLRDSNAVINENIRSIVDKVERGKKITDDYNTSDGSEAPD